MWGGGEKGGLKGVGEGRAAGREQLASPSSQIQIRTFVSGCASISVITFHPTPPHPTPPHPTPPGRPDRRIAMAAQRQQDFDTFGSAARSRGRSYRGRGGGRGGYGRVRRGREGWVGGVDGWIGREGP